MLFKILDQKHDHGLFSIPFYLVLANTSAISNGVSGTQATDALLTSLPEYTGFIFNLAMLSGVSQQSYCPLT